MLALFEVVACIAIISALLTPGETVLMVAGAPTRQPWK